MSISKHSYFIRRWPLLLLAVGSVFEYRFGKSPSITLLEIISLAVLFQIFLDRVAIGKRFDNQFFEGLNQVKAAVPFFFWAFVCGLFAMAFRSNMLNLWQFRELFPSIVMLITLACYRMDIFRLKQLLFWYFLASTIIAIIATLQVFTGHPQIVDYNWAFDAKMDLDGKIIVNTNKSTGFSTHPNALAAFLILPLALLFTRIRYKMMTSVTIIYLVIALMLMVISLKGTYAKGGWAWVAISVFAIFLLPQTFLKRGWLPAIIASCFGLTLLFISLYLFYGGYHSFATILTRVRLWQAAWAIICSDWYVWLFGNGQLKMPIMSWQFSDIAYANAHSSLVNMPLIYGVPGTAFFLLMCFSAYNKALKVLNDESLKLLSWMLMTVLSVYFWNALFEPHLEGGGSLAQFTLIITLCFAVPNLLKYEYKRAKV